jgi:hypothetical protein
VLGFLIFDVLATLDFDHFLAYGATGKFIVELIFIHIELLLLIISLRPAVVAKK